MARDLDLAVVMIVKNEEKNIANMFNSFRDNGLTPDFYITDTGSTDNTVKICKLMVLKFSLILMLKDLMSLETEHLLE
jgi:glycosyltransferase involved in cell wall biosynthesis